MLLQEARAMFKEAFSDDHLKLQAFDLALQNWANNDDISIEQVIDHVINHFDDWAKTLTPCYTNVYTVKTAIGALTAFLGIKDVHSTLSFDDIDDIIDKLNDLEVKSPCTLQDVDVKCSVAQNPNDHICYKTKYIKLKQRYDVLVKHLIPMLSDLLSEDV